ncbi:MAG: hypothetical protein EXQ94_12965 [Alphaproteobacteria bacterium]|nr:hypothetical protein [Alphaproteobacteria bacterium]
MARHTYLSEHLAAWSLCAAIFGAMLVLSPLIGEEAAATPSVAIATFAAMPHQGVREARGQRWQPSANLAGMPNSMVDLQDLQSEGRTTWARGLPQGAPAATSVANHPNLCPNTSS